MAVFVGNYARRMSEYLARNVNISGNLFHMVLRDGYYIPTFVHDEITQEEFDEMSLPSIEGGRLAYEIEAFLEQKHPEVIIRAVPIRDNGELMWKFELRVVTDAELNSKKVGDIDRISVEELAEYLECIFEVDQERLLREVADLVDTFPEVDTNLGAFQYKLNEVYCRYTPYLHIDIAARVLKDFERYISVGRCGNLNIVLNKSTPRCVKSKAKLDAFKSFTKVYFG